MLQQNKINSEMDISNHRKKWRRAEERVLVAMYNANDSYATIANKLKRTESAITTRLQVLGYLGYDKETKSLIRIK